MPVNATKFSFIEEVPIGTLRYIKATIAIMLYRAHKITKDEAIEFAGMEETEFTRSLEQVKHGYWQEAIHFGEEAFDDLQE